jgi:dipeptidyl aminopeptidase/acylaminoacyl peptidase
MYQKLNNIFIALLLLIALVANSQTKVQNSTLQTGSNNAQWDLNKYVWSHTHYRTGKTDKPVLDYDAIENYIGVAQDRFVSISDDGKYMAYSLCKGWTIYPSKLVIQSVSKDWRQEFAVRVAGFFSGDGKQYIFQDKEALTYVKCGTNTVHVEPNVASFKKTDDNRWIAYQLKNETKTVVLQNLITGEKKQFQQVTSFNFPKTGNWFSCQLSNDNKDLVLFNLVSGQERRLAGVINYMFNDGGNAILLRTGSGLQYFDLSNGMNAPVTVSADVPSITSYSVDAGGKQVVFVRKQADDQSIWYWKAGMEQAIKKADNNTAGIDKGMLIQGASFSDNGNYMLLTLQKRLEDLKPKLGAIQVDVWSYRDSVLQSTQPSLLKRPRSYQAVLDLASSRVFYCEQDYEYMWTKGDFTVIARNDRGNEKESGDRFWEKDYEKGSYKVVSLKDGKVVKSFKIGPWLCRFTPDGRYLIYFDLDRGCNFFTIDLQTGKEVNISADVPAWRLGDEGFYARPKKKPAQPVDGINIIAGWLDEEGAVLVYDNYDIWQLDLAGKKPAVNITNGYGRKRHLILRLFGKSGEPVFLPGTRELLIKAFNWDTKYNGYYKKSLGKAGNPELLYMGPCFITGGMNFTEEGMEPLKASGANVWIVKRQTATEAPNYFLTRDFKQYEPLTDFQPQKQYNWYTTELHSFKQLDGTVTQGILYKPENFDPNRKYPVIINFYGQLSQNLYRFWKPLYIDAPHLFTNPGWMVSHGYLVFLTDIYFTKNGYGPSTVNTVDGAAKYVSTLPFVDAKHVGACGHSNAGRFGYYLFTHSHLFAAMAVGAGTTDFLSQGLSLDHDNVESTLYWAEQSAFGGALGKLWQNKASWLDHTVVLNTDKASCPLLLFHNKRDGVDIRHAVELFTALRRLEKSVWWLQYDRGDHLVAGDDARDYTIRFTQFFDHYLKGAPAPRWMTQGIPAKLKGIEAKYELDPAGSCAMEGKTQCEGCQEWNNKYKNNSEIFLKPINEWQLSNDRLGNQEKAKTTK